MHSCLCLRSLLRMDENMLEIGSILGHMYFLNPSPTATSLKHCLQKLSPYFLTMGPYWPQRLHGRAPFPYFLCFFALILAMGGSQFPMFVPKLFCMNLTASSFET